METKQLAKWGEFEQLGTWREKMVKAYFKKQGYHVQESSFYDDIHNQIDLIATRNGKRLYIQVKGWYRNCMKDDFTRLIETAAYRDATPLAVFIDKRYNFTFKSFKK